MSVKYNNHFASFHFTLFIRIHKNSFVDIKLFVKRISINKLEEMKCFIVVLMRELLKAMNNSFNKYAHSIYKEL